MPPKAGTKVKLDKVRTLRFRARAWEAFEATTGRNVLNGELEKLSFADYVTLIWCGCLHEDPELSRDTILDALDVKMFGKMQGELVAAMRLDMPLADEVSEKKESAKKS